MPAQSSSEGLSLTTYETEQVRAIKAWKNEEPSVVGKLTNFILSPVTWLVQKVVPEQAVRAALEGASSFGHFLADKQDILRDGGVESLGELRTKDLKLSDDLADEVHNWAIGLAVAEGTAAGVTGLPGMALDVPATITIAFRTIHKIGYCYGYEAETPEDTRFIFGVLAASGANSLHDKATALATLRSVQVTLIRQTWKDMAEKAAQQQFSKEGAVIGLRTLAKELGINLTKRKALQAIPVIGAAVGGSVNGWFLKEVGWAARRAYQERWLLENGKVTII